MTIRPLAKIAALLLLTAQACGQSDAGPRATEPVGQTPSPIWSGNPYQPTPPETTGVVKLLVLGSQNQEVRLGSGVALNRRWVLTARHVRGAYLPDEVQAELAGSPGVRYRAQAAFVVNKGSWAGGIDLGNWDMELLRFDHLPINPNQANYVTNIFHGNGGSTSITDQIIALGQVECWGYGGGGPAGSSGILRFAPLNVAGGSHSFHFNWWPPGVNETFSPPRVFFTTPTNGRQMTYGDSGGPCYRKSDYTLVGIMRDIDTSAPEPAPFGVIGSVGGFKDSPEDLDVHLQRIAGKENLELAQFGDVDGDSFPDLAMLSRENGYIRAELQLTSVDDIPLVAQDGLLDWNTIAPFPLIPESYLDTALATIGDFNGNGAGDILALVGGTAIYYDGQSSTIPIPHIDLSPDAFVAPTTTYSRLLTSDLDGDARDDVEALGPEGTTVYYGSPQGLKSGVPMVGFPSADSNDGRFLVLAGRSLFTNVIESVEISVYPAASGDTLIEVFDGEVGGMTDGALGAWVFPDTDPPPATTDVACYLLKSCKNVTVCNPDCATTEQCTPVGLTDSGFFADADNAWKQLEVPATSPYRYTLTVTLGTCDGASCAQPCAADGKPVGQMRLGATHMFKVRSNGDVGADTAEWAFVAMDAAPLTAPAHEWEVPVADTTFDDWFTFPLWLGKAPEGPDDLYFSDCDADYLLDGSRDPTDPSPSPGTAVGANDKIRFALRWLDANYAWQPLLFPPQPAGFPNDTNPTDAWKRTDEPDGVWWWYLDPSGGTTPMEADCEEHVVSASGKAGWWTWTWNDVYPGNIIKVRPMYTSPGQLNNPAVPISVLFDADGNGLASPSVAEPITFWRANGPQVAPLLPVDLGTAVTVADPQLATLLLAEHGFSSLPVHGSQQSWLQELRKGKITLCHRPPADPESPVVMTVAPSAVASHLAHGDDPSAPVAMAQMLAELLVTKLNVKAALQEDEILLSATLYGRSETVAEIVAEADAAAGDLDGLCARGDSSVERIRWLTRRLRAINAGDVSYARPVSTIQFSATARTPLMLRPNTLAPATPPTPYVGF